MKKNAYFMLLICCFLLSALTFKDTNYKDAYKIFDQKGKQTDYAQMLKKMQNADIVFFGELHNNPICHWLQIELTQDLFTEKKSNLVLGAEMFEADKQLILNEFLNKIITEKQFKDESKPWNNYDTDYKPLVDFAQTNKIPFIATNIPRRYASIVSKKGTEGLQELSVEAKTTFPPLPITFDLTLPAYANMKEMMGGGGTHGGGVSDNFLKAQAVKDATMAHFILKNWQKGKLFLHFNGSYHSDNFESIVWYLKKQNPNLKIVTIASAEQKELKNLDKENKNKADFILITPLNMTKTY